MGVVKVSSTPPRGVRDINISSVSLVVGVANDKDSTFSSFGGEVNSLVGGVNSLVGRVNSLVGGVSTQIHIVFPDADINSLQ